MLKGMSVSGMLSAAANLFAVVLIVAFLNGHEIPLFLSYFAHKVWHIVGAILLIGHAFTGAVWFVVAWQKRDRQLLQFSSYCYRLLDIICTVPGILLLVVNGLAMASGFKDEVSRRWIVQSMYVLLGTSAFSAFILLPIQERLMGAAESESPESPFLLKMWIAWSVAGTVIFIPLGAVFWLMVTKQPF